MKILFDLRTAQIASNRGIGRYAVSLLRHILKNTPENEIQTSVLLFKEREHIDLSFLRKDTCFYYIEDIADYNFDECFDFWFIDSFFDSEVVKKISFSEYFPKNILIHTKKIVGIMHDLIPLVFAKDYLDDEQKRLQYLFEFETLKCVDHFFTNSKHTMEDAIKYTGLNREKFTTIYGGIGSESFNCPDSSLEYSAKSRTNNIVCVAASDKRKNSQGLIAGFALAYCSNKIPKDARLYICCNFDIKNQIFLEYEIKKNNLTHKTVILTGYISDENLINLVSTAKATVFPSFYEGLGLPVIESYAAGTPSFTSARSSTKELAHPDCLFNPYSAQDISDTIVKIYNDEELCKKSLSFGRKLLTEHFNWDTASKIVLNKLKELDKKTIQKTDKIAVFGALPPETTGLAPYNALTFGTDANYDVFSAFVSKQNMEKAKNFLKKDYANNFFPIESYDYFTNIRNYTKKIFVLGGSPHNVAYLSEAIKQKDKNNWLYLHEAHNLYLLAQYYQNNKFFLQHMSKLYEREIKKIDDKIFPVSCVQWFEKNRLFGIRLILALTGAENIIVNNQYCKELIEKDIKGTVFENKLNIVLAFLPIPDLKNTKSYEHNVSENTILIGTFGMPSEDKGTKTIINAVHLLNSKYKIKTNLLMAGYSVDSYISEHKHFCGDTSQILTFDWPDDDKLASLMKSVDIAIQLRNNPHGESSGCIAQLLSLDKKIITTKNFVDIRFERYCKTVDSNISPEHLAEEIVKYLKEKLSYPTEAIINEYSYKRLTDFIKGL
ncbi:MAG: glycosyltransferase [Firmicutes bacterium]|nr:glycosyltransferase [Bacillota bacterium]